MWSEESATISYRHALDEIWQDQKLMCFVAPQLVDQTLHNRNWITSNFALLCRISLKVCSVFSWLDTLSRLDKISCYTFKKSWQSEQSLHRRVCVMYERLRFCILKFSAIEAARCNSKTFGHILRTANNLRLWAADYCKHSTARGRIWYNMAGST